MTLTTLDEDLAVHQKLPDEPNDVGGLTAQELKAKFDQAGLAIQKYLNEVHLPQVEQAIQDVRREAEAYTDGKVVAVGAGDMATAVYDTEGRRVDLYQYAHDEAVKVMGSAARFGYVALGKAEGKAAAGQAARVTMTEFADPRQLWNGERQCFVIPQGAQFFGVTAQIKWARQPFSGCGVRLMVNGQAAQEISGPDDASGSYIRETVMLAAPVQGGDQVWMEMTTRVPLGYQAEAEAQYVRGEVLR